MLVTAWLGKATEDSHLAVELLDRAARWRERTWDHSIQDNPFSHIAGAWVALNKFLSRPYWTRLWIIQEVALSDETLAFRCGHHVFSWKALKAGLMTLSEDLDSVIKLVSEDYSVTNDLTESLAILDRITRLRALATYLTSDLGCSTFPSA
jgi:hypothetical protein